jgi:hypothetical protein
MSNMLVVATNRPDQIEKFVEAWKSGGFDQIIVVFDGAAPSLVRDLPSLTLRHRGESEIRVVDWSTLDRCDDNEIYSRQDSGIKSYGFRQAWVLGAKIIVCLDDDCLPSDASDPKYLLKNHIHNLTDAPLWTTTLPGHRVRGLPYQNMGVLQPGFSMGLWHKYPDYDAVTSLTTSKMLTREEVEAYGTRVMPAAQFFPFCGMNFAFARDMAVLTYFPKMGKDSPYSRFDDIWAGLIIQKICRQLDRAITVGLPLVRHDKASNPFTNLVKEAPGIRDNEWIWQFIQDAQIDAHTPADCMMQMSQHLQSQDTQPYLREWGSNIAKWVNLFN